MAQPQRTINRLALVALLCSGCMWQSVGPPPDVKPDDVGGKVRVVIGDTTYTVRRPIVAGDSISGNWQRQGALGGKGPHFTRTEALANVREIQTYSVSNLSLGLVLLGAVVGSVAAAK
jgi:hypothetical protein